MPERGTQSVIKTRLILSTLLVVAIAWPPLYSMFVDRDLRMWYNGHGRMEDFELQLLLGAQRWIVDIPKEKDGWFLGLETKSDGDVKTSGGSSVVGGNRIVLLTRRNSDSKRIEYAWYQINTQRRVDKSGPVTFTMNLRSFGTGSVDDPLVSAGVTSGRQDGLVQIGEPIYRGGKSTVQGFPSETGAEYEVRVVLSPPGKQ